MPIFRPLTRRALLGAASVLAIAGEPAWADAVADAMSPRTLGDPKAPVHVEEWFSLTCTHCARFDQTVLPDVRTKLIDTGRVFYTFKDFPLDAVALMAAQIARSLPPDRYAPFVDALFASQDRWAFAQNVDTPAVLKQMAALAGMNGDQFVAALENDKLKAAILAERQRGVDSYKIDSTPTFLFGTKKVAGEMTYEMFASHVKQAAAG
jgi:protein-disulfide isomerase